MNRRSEFGSILVDNEAMAKLIGETVSECYGVVGMTSKSLIKDGINDLLGKDSYSKGVVIREKNDKLELDLYVVIIYGVRSSEVAIELQKKIAYVLDRTLNLKFDSINVYVEGIKVID
ncbi:MAG: Asp23/Gls24 family envelope stress response protein [Erysipelotrichaceae bacterium]